MGELMATLKNIHVNGKIKLDSTVQCFCKLALMLLLVWQLEPLMLFPDASLKT